MQRARDLEWKEHFHFTAISSNETQHLDEIIVYLFSTFRRSVVVVMFFIGYYTTKTMLLSAYVIRRNEWS